MELMASDMAVSPVRRDLDRFSAAAHRVAHEAALESARAGRLARAAGGVRRVHFSEGPARIREGRFTLRVEGDGFLPVETRNGPAFTRGGEFRIDAEGNIVTPEGALLLPTARVPAEADTILVTEDGRVLLVFPGGGVRQIGLVPFVSFAQPGGLVPMEGTLFGATAASGPPLPGATGSILFGTGAAANPAAAADSLEAAFARARLDALVFEEEFLGELLDILG